MKNIFKFIIILFLLIFNTGLTFASPPSRYPEDNWQALSQLLSDKSVPITWKDTHGHSIVFLHLLYGSDDVVISYLRRATPHDLKEMDANALLVIAAEMGNQRIVRALLEKGVSPNPKISPLFSPLMAAAANGKLEVMRMLIKAKANVKWYNEYGSNALTVAMEAGQFHAVNLLLENGYYLNAYKKQENNNSIIFKAILGKSREILELLLRNDFSPNVYNKDGLTPLAYAIYHDSGLNVIGSLSYFGADQCIKTKDGKLPKDIVLELKENNVQFADGYVGIFKKECIQN